MTAVTIYPGADRVAGWVWIYPDVYLDPPTPDPGQRVRPPVALAARKDLLVPVPSRGFVERVSNIVQRTDRPEAGHVATRQRPRLLLEDERQLPRLLREREG